MEKEYTTLSEAEVHSYPDGTLHINTEGWGATYRDIAEIHRYLKSLEGKVLTLLEASIADDRQLEALKSVVRQEIVAVYNHMSPKRRLTETFGSDQEKRNAEDQR